MVRGDSNGVTGDRMLHQKEQYQFFQYTVSYYFFENFELQRFFIIQKTFFLSLEFQINQVLLYR
jgi:hypothetical protein